VLSKNQRKGHQAMIAEYKAGIEKAKIGLMGSSKIIRKNQTRIAVKINPDFFTYKNKCNHFAITQEKRPSKSLTFKDLSVFVVYSHS
jgi:hypothetical protein